MRRLHTTIGGQAVSIPETLIQKYASPGPRYTSYPTVPVWKKDFSAADFRKTLAHSNQKRNPLSFYVHIPFCEERCTFCACNVVATPRKEVADSYLSTLAREMETATEPLDPTRPLEQIHWGGGTPTYLSLSQIEILFRNTVGHFALSEKAEVSIEIDPRVTNIEQLQLLRRLGFNRISLGVQDFHPAVQKAIGRIQPETQTRETVETCRKLGFKSINCDLVYGLPHQTLETFRNTLHTLLKINPDRIALFHFAYVPWLQAQQRKIDSKNLPDSWTKLEMFSEAITTLQEVGYTFIGLDHFAKAGDELTLAKKEDSLHRNFQGYTTKAGCDLVSFGMTSISEVGQTFSQNAKKLIDYTRRVQETGLATERGLALCQDDLIRQWVIGEIFCHQQINKSIVKQKFGETFNDYFKKELFDLSFLQEDGLITLDAQKMTVTPMGRFFLRNIAKAFDAYFTPATAQFSATM